MHFVLPINSDICFDQWHVDLCSLHMTLEAKFLGVKNFGFANCGLFSNCGWRIYMHKFDWLVKLIFKIFCLKFCVNDDSQTNFLILVFITHCIE